MGIIDNIIDKIGINEETKENIKTFVDKCCKRFKEREGKDKYDFY